MYDNYHKAKSICSSSIVLDQLTEESFIYFDISVYSTSILCLDYVLKQNIHVWALKNIVAE